ncbi:pseudaminic acid synthase [Methylosinus sp. C49]|uniref:pseudaminic acid synthase n=1 Tax=Methylosinus sp. C49 TaxID=2699395 RepID=UPI0013673A1B|nr:pseudaminic acid synthase [Methylosinus sp. C49]BBU63683.1 pseudaminic acid synthase [Methylosinus sp. C49]
MVGPDYPPLIVAEMSGNHNHSLDRALTLVEAAAKAGAHALKLQTYTADTMTLDCDKPGFVIEDANSLWAGAQLYRLYDEAQTPWEWHAPLFARARELGMIPFSTPFDATAVEFLETLNSACYKIASFENTDIALIRRVAATGKPLIISTGMASVGELAKSVSAAREAGCENLVLLKCTSTYPATADNSNISTIPHMRQLFECQVGLSDHTMGTGVSVASVAFGATVIEKHFTLARSDGGVDSAFSLEPDELHRLVIETERAWRAIGRVHYGATEAEQQSLQFRRSLYIAKDLRAGERLTRENVRAIRPGFGLAPEHLEEVLGAVLVTDVERGTPLSWTLLR